MLALRNLFEIFGWRCWHEYLSLCCLVMLFKFAVMS